MQRHRVIVIFLGAAGRRGAVARIRLLGVAGVAVVWWNSCAIVGWNLVVVIIVDIIVAGKRAFPVVAVDRAVLTGVHIFRSPLERDVYEVL